MAPGLQLGGAMRRPFILTIAAFFVLGAAAGAFAQSGIPPARPYNPLSPDDPRYDPRDAPQGQFPQGQPMDQQQPPYNYPQQSPSAQQYPPPQQYPPSQQYPSQQQYPAAQQQYPPPQQRA